MNISDYRKWFEAHRKELLEQFFEFLRFKSISTDPVHSDEVKACARWLKQWLEKAGMQVQLWETGGHPALFAERPGKGPTVLVYHHYDVQPIDPIEEWVSDPFKPEVRSGNVYARGAVDNKGQCFYSLCALRCFLELMKDSSLHIKYFIEGEEEIGSPKTAKALSQYKKQLKADYLLGVDSHLPAPNVPGITLGLRGIVTMELTCENSEKDLHSGSFGGAVSNPIKALCGALHELWTPEGKVTIPHFYDKVRTLTKQEHALFTFKFDEQHAQKAFGIRTFASEPGFSLAEGIAIRPTIEINGIWGGYTQAGFKTVLPARAHAKVSCRLVPDQDPEEVFQLVSEAFKRGFPKGMKVSVKKVESAPAFRSDPKAHIAKTVTKAYEEVMKTTCQRILTGGSIPIMPKLAEASGAEAVMMGFGLDEDDPHSPNEHFGLDRFEMGFLTMGRIFSLLAQHE